MKNNDILYNLKTINIENIETSKWGHFFIGDLFKSNTGDFDIQKKHISNKGEFVVSSGTTNNGIIGKTQVEAKVFKGNTITVDMFGNSFFRGFEYKMVTHGRVFSLELKEKKGKYQNIYLSTILNNILPYLYNYNNMCSWNKIKQDKIQLPVALNSDTNEMEPDWNYMEKYILTLEKQLNINEIDLIKNHISESKTEPTATAKWNEFDFFYIFNKNEAKTGIVSPKKYKIKKNNTINYISAGTTNNACDAYIERELYVDNIHSKCLTMGTRGEYNGNMFYQEEEFVNSNTCMLLKYNKFNEVNNLTIKNISLFIATVWNKNKKYGSYGIYPTLKSLNEDVIKLPSLINEDGEIVPDWQFMNDFIKSLGL